MNYNLLLKGLDCAGCAAKIETKLQGDPTLSNVNLNFSLLKLSFDSDLENESEAIDYIQKRINKIEQGVIVQMWHSSATATAHQHNHTSEGCCHSHDSKSKQRRISNDTWREILIPSIGFILGLLTLFFIQDSFAKWTLFGICYAILSYRILYSCAFHILRGQIFDENLLMSLAAIGAIVTGEHAEALAVMFLFQLGEFLQGLAASKSKKNIAQAMDLKVETANLFIDDTLKTIPTAEVKLDDILIVRPGEKIPVDGVVTEGSSYIDTSSLTGESTPRNVSVGDSILSGCINGKTPLTIKATTIFEDSTVARIIDMVENASSRKSKAENFITKFARVYTPIVVISALLFAIVPPILLQTFDFIPWIYKACGFLVVSCPCALIISVPLGFFSGIGCASKNGILIKGSNYLDALSKIDTVIFDKTGTLTEGCFQVVDLLPSENITKEQLLEIAARLEVLSTHPIAQSIVNAYNKPLATENETYFEIAGKGITCDGVYVGNKALMVDKNLPYDKNISIESGTIVYVSSKMNYYGAIKISDKIKADSAAAVRSLLQDGYNVIMLTGDRKENADYIAKKLGITNVYSELLPDGKVNEVSTLINEDGKHVLFVGDGINDAPVLAMSDVGVAMGGIGSDATIEAADVVLMNDEPSKICTGLKISKITRKIVTENIMFSLGVKLIILVLVAFGLSNLWLAIFADVGVALIAIFNSLRILGYRATPAQ